MWLNELINYVAAMTLHSAMVLAVLLPGLWFGLALFYPKSLFDRYVREPQFSKFEIYAFQALPHKLNLVSMTGFILCWPNKLGKKREMTDIREHAPMWFKVLSVLLLIFVAWTLLMILTMAAILALDSFLLPNLLTSK